MQDTSADTDADSTLDRITALEDQVARLTSMCRLLTAALIDTAQATGYRNRHVKLARDGLRYGFLDYREF